MKLRKLAVVGLFLLGGVIVSTCNSTGATATGSSNVDGYNYGDSYWPTAKDNGLSDAQECSALSSNAPRGDDIEQWVAGCVAAGKALVSNGNDTGGS